MQATSEARRDDQAAEPRDRGSLSTLVLALTIIALLAALPVAVWLDLRDLTSIDATVRAAAARHGRLDVLVNNAGMLHRGPAIDVTPEEWTNVMGVNVTGTFFMMQHFARHLIAEKRPGAIVNLASTMSFVGTAGFSTYGISKGTISHMTKTLAIEWAPHRIRVNAIAPGSTETKLRAAAFSADPALRQRMLDRIPLGRFGDPEEMGAAVAYLAGAHAGYITGQTLLLDGGFTSY
ncbi:MAG: SDR family oxidoreductase [Rhizobiales bacterium]|nr:SDR family oxidoreductase [Hyphomicrobiales bacterium]